MGARSGEVCGAGAIVNNGRALRGGGVGAGGTATGGAPPTGGGGVGAGGTATGGAGTGGAPPVEPSLGAVRLGTQGGDALAFRNPDGSIVTVLYNSGGETQMTLSVGGQNLQFTVPGQGWATVNWQG